MSSKLNVNVKIHGIDELSEAIEKVQEKLSELERAIEDVNAIKLEVKVAGTGVI